MNLKYEKNKIAEGFSHVIGCDEVGRGCLAGPVVAAAVIIDVNRVQKSWASRIKDSKKLTSQIRSELSPIILESSFAWGIGVVPNHQIDRVNIHNASLIAMKKAIDEMVKGSATAEPFLYIDGKFTVPQISFTQEAVVNGDNKVFSIACASIIAKVYRDKLMQRLDKKYPEYMFARHKGYGTKLHVSRLKEFGLSEVHRLSFCANLL